MTDLPLAILFGLLIGVALGALGGGGSILAVPALVYGLGLPLREAIQTSLLVVGITAATAAWAHVRAGTVWIRTALAFAGVGVLGSFAGAWLNHRVDEGVVLGGLAVLMVVAAVGMWRRGGTVIPTVVPLSGGPAVDVRERRIGDRLPQVLAAGAGLGVLTGLFGVGGGFLIVPTMVLLVGVPTQAAIGTSLVVISANAGAGFLAHLGMGSVDMAVAAAFAAGGVVGAFVGQCAGSRVSAGTLSRAFALLVLSVGSYTLFDVLMRG
ncbi:MAG: sulfite exporter TauE/SafE family protein [Actinomycetota bacterium]